MSAWVPGGTVVVVVGGAVDVVVVGGTASVVVVEVGAVVVVVLIGWVATIGLPSGELARARGTAIAAAITTAPPAVAIIVA